MHVHNHDHGHSPEGQLRLALALTLAFAGIEAAGGLWSGSLTLLGDAGHMFTDALALGMAAAAAVIARRPATYRHSYGLGRVEIVAALVNALLMIGVVTTIAAEAIERLESPTPVHGLGVMAIAAAGLTVNIIVAGILHRSESNLNVRGALLHVMGDLLGSVAALAAGAIILFTGWTPIDPILALVVCALILYSTLQLLKDSLHVVMEGVPPELELPQVGKAMAEVPGVASVHDLHIWTLSSGQVALSAHVVLDDLRQWNRVLAELSELLDHRFGINHITLQPESAARVLQHFESPPGIETGS